MNSTWGPYQSWWQTNVDTQTLGLYLRYISNFLSSKMVYFFTKNTITYLYFNLKMTNEAFCKTVGKDVQVFCWPKYISTWAVAFVPENIVSREFWSICYQNHQKRRPFLFHVLQLHWNALLIIHFYHQHIYFHQQFSKSIAPYTVLMEVLF